MDRSLDDVISERRGPPRGRRGGGRYDDRRDRDTRGSYRKPDEQTRDPEDAWVHDRFDGDRSSRREYRDNRDSRSRTAPRIDRYEPGTDRNAPAASAKLRVDNLHYDLEEEDIKWLFGQQGPIARLEVIYDRAGRMTGQAYITYESPRDADRAVNEFNGQMAKGQRIELSRVPIGPSGREGSRGGFGARVKAPVGRDSRSLFDRVERRRSESPRRSNVTKPAPEGVDRYVPRDRAPPPRRRSRSPLRRGGGRGDRGGRRGRGASRMDSEGRPLVGGRPRMTAEQLDAEMNDYWGSTDGAADEGGKVPVNGQAKDSVAATDPPETAGFGLPAAAPAAQDEDIDMIE